MKKYLQLIVTIAFLFSILNLSANEGMWLPLHVKRLNQTDMEKLGLKLSAEEIYGINNSSLKDAIVSLGGFCTGEIISSQGLMLTNHHCGYDEIQKNSSLEHDYLTDGFWAMDKSKEIPAQGLTASILVYMKNVTEEVLTDIPDSLSENDRNKLISEICDSLGKSIMDSSDYKAQVKSFFEGNEFYLFVYEVFKDVRLVGAPPSSVGKFGGDTDNWMWPRHTGDFSLFRIYANNDNEPAEYHQDNQPYQPKHHLPISLGGVKESDFTMVFGFPGRTDRFLTSHGIKRDVNRNHPSRVKIREKRLQLMKEDMDSDVATRIKYASKYAQVSNYYKYFKGQIRGLNRLKVEEKKLKIEKDLTVWIDKDPERKETYGEALDMIEFGYSEADKYKLAQVYFYEAIFGTEIIPFALGFMDLSRTLASKKPTDEIVVQKIDMLKPSLKEHFKDYNSLTDQKITGALLKLYFEDVDSEFHPTAVKEKIEKKFKGDYDKYAAFVFAKSVLTSEERLNAFLAKPNAKKLQNDPGFTLMRDFIILFQTKINSGLELSREKMDKGSRLFVAALREMDKDTKYYPDANSTLRLSYGQVLDYYPRDAVYYNFYTTLDGIMEKEVPNDEEFHVPPKLRDLYLKKDYGDYAENGVMKVNFISNNDITGGNSGSPVINGNGQLIGCAFDGNWEAMSGDIAFEPDLQRTISVDIRYILFIIDKYAGAKHLVDEMTLVKS